MTKKRKSKTLTGRRIPIELDLLATDLQRDARRLGKKLSKQDIMRQIARAYRR